MEYNLDDYAKLEARLSPVYGWFLDTVKKYSCDELDTMHSYFYARQKFVAVALNTFKELVTETVELENKVNILEQKVIALEKHDRLPSAVPRRSFLSSLFRH